jgi:hypothetical protein
MSKALGASVPDQALLASLAEPASGLVPTGDDPSRKTAPPIKFVKLDKWASLRFWKSHRPLRKQP